MTTTPTPASPPVRPTRRRPTWSPLAGVAALAAALSVTGVTADPGAARADAVAYLVNVTVRPGYHFPTADAALAYGRDLCAKLAAGASYGQLVGDIGRDFATTDEYQATYLLGQAANELCPDQIWQLRRSAAHTTAP